MEYRIARNYEECLSICKDLLIESIGESDFGSYVPFNCYEEWESYFEAELPVNEEDEEYLPIEEFKGTIGYRPNENEYPVLIVENFSVHSDFRNGDITTRFFDWKPLRELSLKIDEEELEGHTAEMESVEGESISEEAFISFRNDNNSLKMQYLPLVATLRKDIPVGLYEMYGKDAEDIVERFSHTLFSKGDVEFVKNKSIRHIVELIPCVSLVVTVSHKTMGLGKEQYQLVFEGVVIEEGTTKENIVHLCQLFKFTGFSNLKELFL